MNKIMWFIALNSLAGLIASWIWGVIYEAIARKMQKSRQANQLVNEMKRECEDQLETRYSDGKKAFFWSTVIGVVLWEICLPAGAYMQYKELKELNNHGQ